MLKYENKQTDSIGADFGFTDEQMKDLSKEITSFHEDFTKVIIEDDENDVPVAETARKWYAEFAKRFPTQEKQDLYLIQSISNQFGDAIENLQSHKMMQILKAL
jgi:aminoglycoside phosphotransferase family enzyme